MARYTIIGLKAFIIVNIFRVKLIRIHLYLIFVIKTTTFPPI